MPPWRCGERRAGTEKMGIGLFGTGGLKTRPTEAVVMASVLIFANPISGRGRSRTFAQRLEHRLVAEGYEVRVFLERADRVRRAQLDPKAVAGIVVGGGGTLRGGGGGVWEHDIGPGGPALGGWAGGRGGRG